MARLVAQLDDASVPLYAITNFSAEFWTPFRAREAALFDRFRDIVVSGEEKMVKPDPRIFALALRRFGIAAGTALFIDDRPDNVAVAQDAGMKAHLFSDEPGLRTRLREEGVLAA